MGARAGTRLGVALGLAALGCGGGEAPPAAGRAMSELVQEGAAAPPDAAGNRAPLIERVELLPHSPRPGERLSAEVEVSDPDGDRVELVYQWRVDGRRLPGAEPWLHIEGFGKNALVELTVYARDGANQSEPETRSVRVGNQPPLVQGVVLEPLAEPSAQHDISANARGEDPDGDPLEFHFGWSVNGEPQDETGPVLVARRFRRGDRIQLSVVASDGNDESEPLRSDPIEVVNAPPRVTSQPGGVGEDGVFRYAVEAEDPDGDRLFRYRLLEGPKGMRIGAVDGQLEWAPAADQAGRHRVSLEVDDRAGGTSTQAFVVEIAFEDVEAQPTPAAPAR